MLRSAIGAVCAATVLLLSACGEKNEPVATATAPPENHQDGGTARDRPPAGAGHSDQERDEDFRLPPPGNDPCRAALGGGVPERRQNGPPPTVRVPARAWVAEAGLIRAMYPASGSNEPCRLGIAPVGRSRIYRPVIRILNPAIATSDLRYWCVETGLPPTAPRVVPARVLGRVDPAISRQLRSGRGCLRIPYAPERPR